MINTTFPALSANTFATPNVQFSRKKDKPLPINKVISRPTRQSDILKTLANTALDICGRPIQRGTTGPVDPNSYTSTGNPFPNYSGIA